MRPAVICRNSNVKLKVSTVEKAGLKLFTILGFKALCQVKIIKIQTS